MKLFAGSLGILGLLLFSPILAGCTPNESPPVLPYKVDVHVGWVLYYESSNVLEFPRSVTASGPFITYVPSEARWKTVTPAWAQGRREEILRRIKAAPGLQHINLWVEEP